MIWNDLLTTAQSILFALTGEFDTDEKELLTRALDTNGDGSGTSNANGDYSGAEEVFYIQPPAGVTFYLSAVNISIEDTNDFDGGMYGSNIVLTNGISMRIVNDAGRNNDLMDNYTVKTNGNWGSLCHDINYESFGTGSNLLGVRWSFKDFGQFIQLDGDKGGRLEVVLHDDFTGLVSHHFFVNGFVG